MDKALTWTVRVMRSRRKTVGIEIAGDGVVIVRAPLRMPSAEIGRILESRRAWIEKAIRKMQSRAAQPKLSVGEVEALAQEALKKLPPRVREWADRIGVTYGRVTIRNQRTRWGSCSSQGNLNFNCLLMLCPEEIQDYVIVHELCHRKELNHSPRFWAEVEKHLPDYRQAVRWLKNEGQAVISRMR